MRENSTNYTERIRALIIELGADLVGVADAEPLRQLPVDPSDLLDPFKRAISIAIRLPNAVFEEITDRPTRSIPLFISQQTGSLTKSPYAPAISSREMGLKVYPSPHPRSWITKTGMVQSPTRLLPGWPDWAGRERVCSW